MEMVWEILGEESKKIRTEAARVSLPQDILVAAVAAVDATHEQSCWSGNHRYAPVCMKSNVSSLEQ